jgi:hypothetical protein
MLTSVLLSRLLEGLARKIAVCRGPMDSALKSVCVYPRIRVSQDSGQATDDGGAIRDNPDAWVPATQLKGHNEQV